MARPREHLRNAPIVEAVIDFRVLRKADISPDSFMGLAASIGYTDASLIQTIEARFGPASGGWLNAPVASAVGWQYRGSGSVAQFRTDGFTFSKLEPYTDWNEVFGEAVRLWTIYVETALPQEISRIAVRYINRLHVPAVMDLREYLEAPPRLPQPMPQAMREFLSRVTVEDHARNASAVLVQALEPAIEPGKILVLLDIDAFMEGLSIQPNDSVLPELFQQLRRLKNDIFYANITEKVAEMYQ